MNVWGTIGIALVSAFLSTIVLQYLFAPRLEARKARLLEAGIAEAEYADKLEQLAFAVVGLLLVPDGTTASDSMFHKQQSTGSERLRELNLPALAGRMRLPSRYQKMAFTAWLRASEIFQWYEPGDKGIPEFMAQVGLTRRAIDPATAPWVRWWNARRVSRLEEKVAPLLTAMDARKRAAWDAFRDSESSRQADE